ncbi:hypothetical protein [Carnobacterium mobile]|uniref:hypothetical protein n=1 Tax=Carnobacterium mobile TaxID=2750 RepID=UPI001868DE0E|nr:hypothetical protein [Carnobacterium mobile]
MSKKLFKLNYNLFLGLSVLWILFLLTPSEPIFAHFSDTASANAGIKLTLGNLALSPENDETFTELTYSSGDPVTLSTHNLKNKGTLNGKLAYQIQVTEKGTDTPVDVSEMQLILSFNSTLGDKTIPASEINSSRYTFITDSAGKEWIFDTNQKEDLPVTIKYKSTDTPEKDREIEITVTFLLVQTNASEPKETMFYDKVSFKHEVKLKAKAAETPTPSEPNYWPSADDKNWKWNGEARYNDSQFQDVMYFSETESGEKVHNLNDFVLYIELPKGKLKKDNEFSLTPKKEGFEIKSFVSEDRRRIKIVYSFNMLSKAASKLLSSSIDPTVSFRYGNENTDFSVTLSPFSVKRMVLSSDTNVPGYFETLPIYTTLKPQAVTFKHISEDWNISTDSWLDKPLSVAKLNYRKIEATVIENSALFDLSVHKASEENNQDYLLINTNKVAKPADLNKKGKLKILITGNNGERLVIYRDLYITKETKQMVASQAIAQNKYDLKAEETQTEQEESVVEKQGDLEETEKPNDLEKQADSNQNNSSEEQIVEDSSVTVPEEQDAAEETFPSIKPVPENSASATENQNIDKEIPVQESEVEETPLENEIKVDTSPPENSLNKIE